MESRSQEKLKNQLQESSSSQLQTLDQQQLHDNQHHMHEDEGPSEQDPDPSVEFSPQRSTATIRYRECLKNHAASSGGHVIDGCGEFMPSGDDGSPEALKCAACNCHRSFHCKETEGAVGPGRQTRRQISTILTRGSQLSAKSSPPHFNTPPPPSLPTVMMHHQHHYAPAAFGGDSSRAPAAESSSEDLNFTSGRVIMQVPGSSSQSGSKKRFRTKFSQEQKNQMHEFAEKIGWRIQKQDEEQVQQFCREVGVKKQVFKVWMHNSKQAEKKRQIS